MAHHLLWLRPGTPSPSRPCCLQACALSYPCLTLASKSACVLLCETSMVSAMVWSPLILSFPSRAVAVLLRARVPMLCFQFCVDGASHQYTQVPCHIPPQAADVSWHRDVRGLSLGSMRSLVGGEAPLQEGSEALQLLVCGVPPPGGRGRGVRPKGSALPKVRSAGPRPWPGSVPLGFLVACHGAQFSALLFYSQHNHIYVCFQVNAQGSRWCSERWGLGKEAEESCFRVPGGSSSKHT